MKIPLMINASDAAVKKSLPLVKIKLVCKVQLEWEIPHKGYSQHSTWTEQTNVEPKSDTGTKYRKCYNKLQSSGSTSAKIFLTDEKQTMKGMRNRHVTSQLSMHLQLPES